MKLEEASTTTALRVFSMVVENAQNIIRYSAEKYPKDVEGEELSFGIIAVGQEKGNYFVICGNIVRNESIDRINNKLSNLQNMNKEELKAHYKNQLKKGPDKDSKGAGLGFIEMARKASKPIEFGFQKIDDEFSFFSLKIVI
jgi:hypothetical protein